MSSLTTSSVSSSILNTNDSPSMEIISDEMTSPQMEITSEEMTSPQMEITSEEMDIPPMDISIYEMERQLMDSPPMDITSDKETDEYIALSPTPITPVSPMRTNTESKRMLMDTTLDKKSDIIKMDISSNQDVNLFKDLPERYSINRFLGRGGFGEVYLINDNVSQTLKVLKITTLTDKESKNKLIKKEIDNLIKISIPCRKNLICLTHYFQINNKIYIITDYINGITLRQFIKNKLYKKLTKQQVVYIMSQLAIALRNIHNEFNMAHMDIKPSNIMIDENLDVYIIDFGISCDDENCDLYGTRGYFSPEFYFYSNIKKPIPLKLAKDSDVFSLGLVFLELLGCTNLFSLDIIISEEEYENTLNNIIEKNPECLYYKEFSDIINGMIQMNPIKRINLNSLIAKLNSM